jgi:hypothetical protein
MNLDNNITERMLETVSLLGILVSIVFVVVNLIRFFQ